MSFNQKESHVNSRIVSLVLLSAGLLVTASFTALAQIPYEADVSGDIATAFYSDGGTLKTWMCCNFVVEPKVGLDDRKFSSSQRTDRE